MTERVDFDRLADFVGGALDGTPDAAEVRRLVDTDTEWAAAHEDLAAAMSSVSAGLQALGEVHTHVPETVVARLDSVLHNLSSSPGADTASRAADAASGGPGAAVDGARADGATSRPVDAVGGSADRSADRAADSVRPGGERGGRGPGGSGPGRERRRRTARWAAGLSAAAAVIAFGIGVVATFPDGSGGDGAADTAANAPEAGEPVVGANADGSGTVVSGRNYRAGAFEGLNDAAPFATAERSSREGVQANEAQPASGPPPELARFRSPAAVEACLDAIRRTYGGDVQVVDLARYEGDPAVVVLLNGASAGSGRPLVVVAGPACGQLPGDIDEVFHGPLG